MTNLRQIGIGILMYAQSGDQKLPFGQKKNSAGILERWYYAYDWAKILGKAIYCPSQKPEWVCGYAYNLNFGYRPGKEFSPPRSGPRYDGVKLINVASPSSKIIVIDSAFAYYVCLAENPGITPDYVAQNQVYAFQFSVDPGVDYSGAKTEVARRFSYKNIGIHRNNINYLYLDGHNSSENPQQINEPAKFWPYVKGNK